MRLCTTLATIALAACGGSASLNPGESSSCTAVLSGAVSGTFDCKPATTVWAQSNNQGGFAFNVPQSGSGPAVSVIIGFPGEPHTGHYRSTDSGASGGLTVQTGSNSIWVAAANTGSSPQGSYDLNFTSVGNALTASNGKSYSTDGTVDATLTAVGGGASGTVNMHVVF